LSPRSSARRAALACLALAASLAAMRLLPAAAQPPDAAPLAQLFPRRAALEPMDGGLARLLLPPEVVIEARPDLSDVRVFDAEGGEIPYLVDRGERPLPRAEPASLVPARPTQVSRERLVERGIARFREVYELAAPGAPPPGARWVLRAESARPRFVSSLRVAAIDPRGGQRELESSSLFRLGQPLRERLAVPLPGVSSERVRVEVSGQEGYLEPGFVFVAQRESTAPATLEVPLAVATQSTQAGRTDGGRTVLRLERPPGVLPERIVLRTSTPSFSRSVEVRAVDPVRGVSRIGAGTVLRVEGVAGAEALELDVSPASGGFLEVEIVDGDSPPLADLVVVAIVRRPALVFESRRAALLRFGGGRVQPPRYDLTGLVGSGHLDRLYALPLRAVAVRAVEDEPDFDPRPALSFAMRAGAPVELARFAARAALQVPETREGLSHVVLPPDVLAAASEDLRDLRVVDAEGRQWPYLLSEERVTLDVPLAPQGPLAGDGEALRGWSRYPLRAPVARLAPESLTIVTPAALVDRDVRIVGWDENDTEHALGAGFLVRRPGDEGELTIGVYGPRVVRLELRVRDGDEAPLAITGAVARVVSRDLHVIAPAGEYQLLAGDPASRAPDYEIGRARALVLAVARGDAALASIEGNPGHRAPGLFERAGADALAMWAALVLAVLVLGVLTVRVARTAPAPPRADSSPEPAAVVAGENPSPQRDEGAAGSEPPPPAGPPPAG
jgi:hypothetical protein